MKRRVCTGALALLVLAILGLAGAPAASAAPGDTATWGPFTYNTAPAGRTITTTEVSRTAPVAPSDNWVLRLTTSTWNGSYDISLDYRCSDGGTVRSGGNTAVFGGTSNHTLSGCGAAGPHSWALGETNRANNVREQRGPWVLFAAVPQTAPVFPPGTACVLSDSQIAAVARAAGFTGDGLQRAVAVALAESSGRVQAVNENPSPLSWDIGLWQINTKAHPTYDRIRLGTDPFYNAQAAYAISTQGTNWQPWVAYNSGAYSRYLSRASVAVSSTPLGVPLSDCQGGVSPDAVATDPDTGEDCGAVDFGCWGKVLFVPSGATMTRAQNLGDTFADAFPFSLLTGAAELLDIATNGCVESTECGTWQGITVDTGGEVLGAETTGVRLLQPDSKEFGLLQGIRPGLALAGWLVALLPFVIYVWRKLFPVVEE